MTTEQENMLKAIYEKTKSKSVFALLGTSTSINVKSFIESNGLDISLSDLTTDNFLVIITSGPSITTATSMAGRGIDHCGKAYGFTVSKTFVVSTGMLTIGGISQTIQGYSSMDTSPTATQTMKFEVYLHKE